MIWQLIENNYTDGVEAKDDPNLLSDCTSNLRSVDMSDIFRQGISIDVDNNSASENVPRQGETTASTNNFRIEVIMCPWIANNLQNYFASFGHYLDITSSVVFDYVPRGLS